MLKWYCCLNETAINAFGESLIVACRSALRNTDLEPNLIYDGRPNSVTRYIETIGVNIHYHQNSFLEKINQAKKQPGFVAEHARGAYLRWDIPLIDKTDDVVLYTDVDVVFLKNPTLPKLPSIFAAAPEYANYNGKMVPYNKCLNSGVLLLNLKNFRHQRSGLLHTAVENDFYFHGKGGFYDQGAMNVFLSGQWDPLPQAMNWRPFGSSPEEPEIIHFHGTKPYELRWIDKEGVRPIAKLLFEQNPTNYNFAIRRFLQYASIEGITALLSEFPNAQILSESSA